MPSPQSSRRKPEIARRKRGGHTSQESLLLERAIYTWYFTPEKDRQPNSAVRNMVRRGVPERVAMAYSGHKTRAVFERYKIVSEADMREAARKMNNTTEPVPEQRDGHNSGHRNVPQPDSRSLAGTAQTQ